MKSIKKLISFNNHRSKDKRDSIVSQDSLDSRVTVELQEDASDLQDLSEMKKQYEGLCAVSSRVSSRAGEFSSAINDLADYFINTFGAEEDGELSKIFKIVGRVQFEVSKNVDAYAAHVAQTITEPSEGLLSELRNVQDSKTQHDEKRQLYEQLRSRMLRGKPKNARGDTFADQQLQVVKDEFDKLSLFVNTRLDSLEKGKARSLITQAARHHTAQMHLFSRGHSSLQAVEPYMRQVARERSIDRQFSAGLNGGHEIDDASEMKSDDDVSYIEEHDDSSDLEQSNRWDSRVYSPGRSPSHPDPEPEVPKNLSKEWNSMLSKLNHTSAENPLQRNGDTSVSTSSQSVKQDQSSGRDLEKSSRVRATPGSTYVKPSKSDSIRVTEVLDEPVSSQFSSKPVSPLIRLPYDTPVGSMARGTGGAVSRNLSDASSPTSPSTSGRTSVDVHPSDVDPIREPSAYTVKPNQSPLSSSESFQSKLLASAQKLQGTMGMGNPPILSFVSPIISPTPAGYVTNIEDASVTLKRYSQSGPLTFSGTPWSAQTSVGNGGSSKGHGAHSSDVHKSGPLGRSPLGRTFGSPRISPSMSPPRMSPPRISELHKLPPPPLNPTKSHSKSTRGSSIITHSAPLSRRTESSGSSFMKPTPLPPPPLGSVPRSLSLPSRQRPNRAKVPSHLPEVDEEGSPSSPATNSSTSPQVNGNFLSQAYGLHKRGQSGNGSDQESGPSSDFKFVHYNSAKSTERSPSFNSQQRRPPSPPVRKDKSRLSEGKQADPGAFVLAPLKSGGVQHSPRWRSLSINDKDSYVQSVARAVAIEREC